MGKKHIIEIEDDRNITETFGGKCTLAVSARLGNTEVFIDTNIPIVPYTEPDIEQVRKEAYDKGMGDAEMLAYKLYSPKIDEAYQHGLNDAWDAARKIDHMSDEDIKNVFGCGFSAVFETIGASEAIEKIRQYEQ